MADNYSDTNIKYIMNVLYLFIYSFTIIIINWVQEGGGGESYR
jgi:hypothetical protein